MPDKFDREIFFDNVRDELFDGALTQQQVDGSVSSSVYGRVTTPARR